MDRKKVLLLTYDMVPYSFTWGGCQRMYYLAQYLTEQQYQISVFAVDDGNGNKNILRDAAFKVIGMSTHKIHSAVNMNSAEVASSKKPLIRKCAGQLINMYLGENSPTLGLSCFFVFFKHRKMIIDFIKKEQVHDVIVSIPPYNMSLWAIYLKKCLGRNINLILDYRDPWNLWHKHGVIPWQREKRALQYSDRITCTTRNLADDLSKCFSINRNKVSVIPNGYSNTDWEKVKCSILDKNIFKISFVGSISLKHIAEYRDISQFLNAFDRFSKLKSDVELHLIGVNDLDDNLIKKYANRFKGKVVLKNYIANTDALGYVVESDALLLLYTATDGSARYIISGKLYDYIKSGRYILSVGPSESAHADILSDYSNGIHVKNTETEIFTALESIYSLWQSGSLNNITEASSDFSRESAYNQFLKLLKDCKE